jgi:rifampicin phosphotransferase
MTTKETIKWFMELDRSKLSVAGGKGANLGELAQAELPVPPGFVITTQAYDTFVVSNQLQMRIVGLATQIDTENPATLELASQEIRALFRQGVLPDALAAEIADTYEQFRQDHGEAVAVRSSATAEDLPTASFAGQQETFLNVRGAEDLLEAVKECWASLWTARAISYRRRQRIEPDAVTIAVVVQAMAPATVSGILFTVNPTTGARDELLVEASFGLGEAIVSGAVTPDSYVLDRENLALKETRLGTKEVMIVANGQGTDGHPTTTQAVPEAQRGQAALSAAALRDLAALGVQVEALFDGVPQDIEWAMADGQIRLLQARPITNLPPAPLRDVRWDPLRPGTIWMRRQVVEHMPEPLSPLFDELYLQEGLQQSTIEMVAYMSEVVGVKFDMWEFVEPPFATTVNGYAYTIGSFDFRWGFVPKLIRVYVQALPQMVRRMLPYWREEGLPAYLATIDQWKRIDLESAADEKLLQGIRSLAMADAVYWFVAAVPLGLARVTDALLDQFLRSDVAGRIDSLEPHPTSGSYLRGFPTKTLEAQAQLEAIARQIRTSDELLARVAATPAAQLLDVLAAHPEGQPGLEGIRHYLDYFGHQIYNLDFVAPTQAEEPLPVLLSLKSALTHPEQDALVHQARLAQEREILVERTAQALGPVDRWFFRLFLGWAQRFSPYREEALFYVGAAWPVLRGLALELGRRLSEAGSLEEPEQIFFLHTAELSEAISARTEGIARPDLANVARERQELREARKRLNPPLSVPPNAQLKFGPFRLALFEPPSQKDDAGPTLDGVAVSPGRVTAPASVIRSPADFDKMVPGTILVCPTTTPAWTPLFSQAKGLVTDIGGALAHGSIVAREYGIPAVMGTGVATQRIQHGQRIHVDGDAGTVSLVDEINALEEALPSTPPKVERRPSSSIRKLVSWSLVAAAVVGLVLWWKRRR